MTLPDGLYLDLAETAYHAERRLSASGLCNLLISPATFWARSWMNADRKDDDTPARILGRAYDVATLTPDSFGARYVRGLDKEEAEDGDVLMTHNAIKEEFRARDMTMTKTGEDVLGAARRLRAAGYEGDIWHLMQEEWEQGRGDREALPPDIFDRVVDEAERIHQDPDVSKLLTGGAAQVSVLWTDAAGLKWKVRFDYLAPGFAVDLKTFGNPRGVRLDQCVADAVRYNRLYIQARLYWTVAERIRNEGVAAHDSASSDFVDAFMGGHAMEWWWIFRETGGVPNVLARQLRLTADTHPHHLYQAPDPHSDADYLAKLQKPSGVALKADAEIKMAVSIYRQAMEVWGETEPWGALQPVGELGDEDFNPHWLEE